MYIASDRIVSLFCAANHKCILGEFRCSDNTCIPRDRMCNGVQDCVDGADEEEVLCKLFCCLNYFRKCRIIHKLCMWVVNFPVISDYRLIDDYTDQSGKKLLYGPFTPIVSDNSA